MSALPTDDIKNQVKVLKAEKKNENLELENTENHLASSKEEAVTDVVEDNTKTVKQTNKNFSNHNDTDIKGLDEEMVNEILELKLKISTLISNIRDTKTLCDRYDNQNQYLQDYVGSLMQSGDIK